MLANVLGKRKYDFITQGGDHIEGHKLYVCYAEEDVQGVKTDAFFIRKEIKLPADMKINDEINIFFNSRGKVEGVTK